MYNPNYSSHLDHPGVILQLLRDHELRLNAKKGNFGELKLEYLGHIISSAPKDLHSLCSFLGLIRYYLRFVRNYGVIAKPLTQLLKKNNFKWTGEVQKQLSYLRKR